MSRCEYCGGSGIVADRLTEYATQQCPACKGLGVLRMTDPITHENTVAEIDDLRARLDAALRENASLRAEHDVTLAEIGVDHTREVQEIRWEYGAAIAALERERDECDALRERMTDLLTRTTNALKGEPAELELHSWHDLPDVAVAIRARNAALVEAVDASKELLEAYDGQMMSCDDPEDGCAEHWSECVGRLRAALARAEAAVKDTKGTNNA